MSGRLQLHKDETRAQTVCRAVVEGLVEDVVFKACEARDVWMGVRLCLQFIIFDRCLLVERSVDMTA